MSVVAGRGWLAGWPAAVVFGVLGMQGCGDAPTAPGTDGPSKCEGDACAGAAAVGAPCALGGDCAAGGACIPHTNPSTGEATGWRDGYCTFLGCDPVAQDCPVGAMCVGGDASSVCLDLCDPGGDACREGYACVSRGGAPVCVPRCAADADCRGAGLCDEPTGACVADLRLAHDVGAACTDATAEGDCGAGGLCLPPTDAAGAPTGFVGGYCTALGCEPGVEGRECPIGAHCVGSGLTAVCLDDCADASECREGYTCLKTGASTAACLPRCSDDAACGGGRLCDRDSGRCVPDLRLAHGVGAACTEADREAACGQGGTCVAEVDASGAPTRYVGGYCTAMACRPGLEGRECPGGSSCFGVGADTLCLADCDPAAASTCRAGYACAPANSDAGGVCVPTCHDATHCDPDGTALRTCDAATGVCVRQLAEVLVGDPCAGDGACGTHGVCLEDGWPDGYCSAAGCGASSPCPVGAQCVGEETGFCFEACDVAASMCRVGYYCAPMVATSAVCLPACASDAGCDPDGTALRRCDLASGRCVPRFDDVPVGAPCAAAASCGTHGICFTAADDYPGGYCSAAPCGAVSPCPTGATCHALTVGVCLDDCAANVDCRTGYRCIEASPAGRACLPGAGGPPLPF